MRQILTRISLFTVMLLLPLGLTRIVGAANFAQGPHVWTIDPSCGAACWLGIQAGQTTLDETRAILNHDPRYKLKAEADKQSCWDGIGADSWDLCVVPEPDAVGAVRIDQFTIWPHENRLELGELINRLGQPYTMEVCKLGNYVTLHLYFDHHIEAQTHFRLYPWEMNNPRLVPRLFMGHITFNARPAVLGAHHVQAWRGFARLPINDVCLN